MHRWLVLVLLLTACGATPAVSTPVAMPLQPTDAPVQMVTITGYDPAAQVDISPVRVWDNYQTRLKVVGTVKTGDKVKLIRRDGTGVLIELDSGVQGWLTDSFIQK